MQLQERIILNSELVGKNLNINSALEESLLELEQLGMSCVLCTEQIKAFSTLASGRDLLAVLRGVGRPT